MHRKLIVPCLLLIALLLGCDALPGATTETGEIQVSLEVDGVADSWEWADIEATPYDNSSPPGPMGLPNHVEIAFNGTQPGSRGPGEPVIFVIPVDAYEELWNEAGDSTVTTRLEQIREVIALGEVPSTGVPTLPMEESAGFNDLAVQGEVTQLGEWNGFRFIGRFEQSANPVMDDDLRYIFQGLSPNGEYFAAVFYPVSTDDVLPETIEDVSAEDMALVESDPQAYMQGQMDTLNALAPSDWNPDLEALDAMVASLRYVGPESGPAGGE